MDGMVLGDALSPCSACLADLSLPLEDGLGTTLTTLSKTSTLLLPGPVQIMHTQSYRQWISGTAASGSQASAFHAAWQVCVKGGKDS